MLRFPAGTPWYRTVPRFRRLGLSSGALGGATAWGSNEKVLQVNSARRQAGASRQTAQLCRSMRPTNITRNVHISIFVTKLFFSCSIIAVRHRPLISSCLALALATSDNAHARQWRHLLQRRIDEYRGDLLSFDPPPAQRYVCPGYSLELPIPVAMNYPHAPGTLHLTSSTWPRA